ncbi:MAG: methyltransferase domain-containing protein [Acidobacteria bacterium]|nr:methyltransferase domain-containing protein [Acidobacteriota bacterium]
MTDPIEKNIMQDFAHAMRRDWDDRARRNAKWFINTFRLEQSDDEFDETGKRDVTSAILDKLDQLAPGRDPKQLRFLEIGCGIGRMTRFLAEIFGEVHATDVSPEMILQARARLAGLNNVSLYVTNGVDLDELPHDFFDIVFSIHVFQHVPSTAVIRSNLDDAYRKLKPGGVLRVQTSSITTFDYEEIEKDTWTGASFPETELRRFAAENDARLISILDPGTQNCWTTVRKPASNAERSRTTLLVPQIVSYGRADDPQIKEIPTCGDRAHLTLIVSGLACDAVDINNLSVEIGGEAVLPQYVGPLGKNYRDALSAQFGEAIEYLVQINQHVPTGLMSGPSQVQVHLSDGGVSAPINIEFHEPQPVPPKIMLIRNASDDGLDVYAQGPKSAIKIYVEGLDLTADRGNLRVQFGERIVRPSYVGPVPANAVYQVNAQLPPNTSQGKLEVKVYFGNLASAGVLLEIK